MPRNVFYANRERFPVRREACVRRVHWVLLAQIIVQSIASSAPLGPLAGRVDSQSAMFVLQALFPRAEPQIASHVLWAHFVCKTALTPNLAKQEPIAYRRMENLLKTVCPAPPVFTARMQQYRRIPAQTIHILVMLALRPSTSAQHARLDAHLRPALPSANAVVLYHSSLPDQHLCLLGF